MSVQSDTSSIQYAGNGSAATSYPVPFVFLEATHIHVIVTDENGVETELAFGTQFTVGGAGSKNGGNVTTTAPVATTRKVTIYREVPAVQQTKFIENDAFPSTAVERSLDALTMICQQLVRRVARCFRLSDASPVLNGLEATKLSENSVIVSGADGQLQLWSIQKLKEEITASAALPPMLQALMVLYPVGAIYITRRTENPRVILGFGTWERYGTGRMLVSLDPANPSLSSIDAVGGEAEHALTIDEIPSHDHIVLSQAVNTDSAGAHTHKIDPPSTNTDDTGAHTHNLTNINLDGAGSTHGGDPNPLTSHVGFNQATSSAGSHHHVVNIAEFDSGSSGDHTHSVTIPEQNTQSTGTGQAHSNMPPYIVVNIWTRINSDAPEDGVGSLPFPADPTLLIDRVTGEARRIVVENTAIGTISAGEDPGSIPFPDDPTLLIDRATGEIRRLVIENTVIGTIPV
jgi:microcystin-dependent protein